MDLIKERRELKAKLKKVEEKILLDKGLHEQQEKDRAEVSKVIEQYNSKYGTTESFI